MKKKFFLAINDFENEWSIIEKANSKNKIEKEGPLRFKE